MGEKNREAFRSGKQPAASFLANELKIEMKVKLSDYDFRDWVREAEKLKEYDPIEVADAMVWAINESDYWSDWDFTMAKFVQYSDRILAQFRGAQRKKKAVNAASGIQDYSSECKALMDRPEYHMWTRKQILEEESRRRARAEFSPVLKACVSCKGVYWIPNTKGWKDAKGKVVKVECPSCKKTKGDLFIKHHKTVKEELYGKAALA